MVYFLDLVAITLHFARMGVAFRGGEVVYPSTAFAEEMRMGRGDCIVAGVSPVDGQGLYRSVFAQEFQGVVHRCLGERGDGGRKSQVNLVHRGMRAMRHQILHYGYPLQGWLDVVALQSF